MRDRPPTPQGAAVDALHASVLEAGESPSRLREIVAGPVEEQVMVAVLRRAVPVAFLEAVASTRPWSERPRILARVVLNPRAPRGLGLRLVPQLSWRDLAEVAAAPWLPAACRLRAETLVREMLRDMRLGDRVTLARLATAAVLPLLLIDGEPLVVEAALQNPRLREGDLVTALRREDVSLCLLRASAASPRWSQNYATRLALVLQPRTPLPLALLQISSLVPRDLRRVVDTPGLRALVRASAATVLEKDADDPNPRRLN
jgi:hypothetical protein